MNDKEEELRPPLTAEQVEAVRQRFYSTAGWTKLKLQETFFAKALEDLPDETKMRRCNSLWREMFEDARRDAILATESGE